MDFDSFMKLTDMLRVFVTPNPKLTDMLRVFVTPNPKAFRKDVLSAEKRVALVLLLPLALLPKRSRLFTDDG